MIVKLKNIYVCDELSEQSAAFQAELYVNNIKAGVAENKGQGGPTQYIAQSEEGRKLLRDAEEWCKGRPPFICNDILVDEQPFAIPITLELILDQQLADYLRVLDERRLHRKMASDMEDGILFGLPGTGYSKLSFKVPLTTVLAGEAGAKLLQSLLHDKVLPQLRDGEKILNTNLPIEVLAKLNVPDDKIVRPTAKEERRRGKMGKEKDKQKEKAKKSAS